MSGKITGEGSPNNDAHGGAAGVNFRLISMRCMILEKLC